MASFPTYTSAEIDTALAKRRLVVVVGQRRSGLSHWTTTHLTNNQLGGKISYIDCRKAAATVEALTSELQSQLNLSRAPTTPSDLIPLIGDLPQSNLITVLLANLHFASQEVSTWLLRATLNPVISSEGLSTAFLAEGAIDVDDLLHESFPSGLTEAPLVLHSDSSAPWHTMVEVEALLASRTRQFPPVLTAFLSDASGGDVGIMNELLDRLPDRDWLDHESFLSACDAVQSRGVTATQISNSIGLLTPTERELLDSLVQGSVILGKPPRIESRAPLRRLYLDGLAVHDPVVCGYRIRSPVIERIVRSELSLPRDPTQEDPGYSVTNYAIWQIANFEMTLRSLLSSNAGLRAASHDVKTVTPWAGRAKLIRDSAARSRIGQAQLLGELNSILLKLLPDQREVVEAVRERLKLEASPSESQVLQGVTMDELLAIALRLGLLKDNQMDLLERIRSVRNSVAHFRSITLESAEEMSAALRCTLQTALTAAPTRTPQST